MVATEGSGTAAADEVAAVTGDETGAFTACMRDHGLPDFPDVTITSDGRVVLDLEAAGIDPLSSTYQEALAACEGELPEGTQLPDQPAAPAAPSAPAALEDSDCAPTAPSAPPEPA